MGEALLLAGDGQVGQGRVDELRAAAPGPAEAAPPGQHHPALAAGLAFLPYASGFALCGLAVPRLLERVRGALPVAGPLVLAAVVVVVAVLSRTGWLWLGGRDCCWSAARRTRPRSARWSPGWPGSCRFAPTRRAG
ncbi:hypothetical protein [Micromonospora globispora]|uniref:hypothetical protein n=1 Tax=Micromonospora globispora TaxID=1450148 RepID=UPI00163A41B0|nr:hypothetical protein [Micromonospora globispora]